MYCARARRASPPPTRTRGGRRRRAPATRCAPTGRGPAPPRARSAAARCRGSRPRRTPPRTCCLPRRGVARASHGALQAVDENRVVPGICARVQGVTPSGWITEMAGAGTVTEGTRLARRGGLRAWTRWRWRRRAPAPRATGQAIETAARRRRVALRADLVALHRAAHEADAVLAQEFLDLGAILVLIAQVPETATHHAAGSRATKQARPRAGRARAARARCAAPASS